MESNEQNKQNRNGLIDTENRLTAVTGWGAGGLSEKGEGVEQYKFVAAEWPQKSELQYGKLVNNIR